MATDALPCSMDAIVTFWPAAVNHWPSTSHSLAAKVSIDISGCEVRCGSEPGQPKSNPEKISLPSVLPRCERAVAGCRPRKTMAGDPDPPSIILLWTAQRLFFRGLAVGFCLVHEQHSL